MKTWFITGTSSGFGRILCEKLLKRGDRVVATLRRLNALDDLKAQAGDRVLKSEQNCSHLRLQIVSLDVANVEAVRRAIDRSFADFGRVEVVVSNAGYGLFGAAEEITDDQVDRQINTNLIGSIALIRACLPHLRRQGGGRILQVSSEGGQITYPGFSLYHATKWGIEGFVEAVAKELDILF
jgi:NAD(P)-dependent dehydrogenase (short-subunit alcohol dehydrogenase family)